MVLNTLKEIIDGCEDVTIKDMEYGIRQNAIEWIKHMNENIIDGDTPQEIKDIINGMNGANNWIKMFFNITNEDLK